MHCLQRQGISGFSRTRVKNSTQANKQGGNVSISSVSALHSLFPFFSISLFLSSTCSSVPFLVFSGRYKNNLQEKLTLVLLNPDISSLCKQCRSGILIYSAGQGLNKNSRKKILCLETSNNNYKSGGKNFPAFIF